METRSGVRPERLTHSRVLKIALPIVISNATVPLLGVVDTGVVGQMGEAAPIGAVGLGAIILSAIYWLFGFLRIGTVGLTSQAIGAGNRPEADAILTRAMLIGGAGGLLLILGQWPIFWAALELAPASPEVEDLVRDYMSIRVFSAPAAIAIFGITGWLIAAERTRAVLGLQLWMNGLNIALNFLFVLSFGWGVEGVAWATFLAEWSGLALGLFFCRDVIPRGYWNRWTQVFDANRLLRLAEVSRDVLIRNVLLEAVFVSFLFVGSDFGDVELAANQILLQFLHVTAYAMDGFAFAAEALVGQAMGAGARDRFRRSAVLTSIWGFGIAAALAAGFAIGGGLVIDIMTTSEPVRSEARTSLFWMVAAPIVGSPAWMFDGIFIGATRTKDLRNMMAISTSIYFVALIGLVPAFGNHGLWIALLVSFAARGATLGMKYPALEADVGAARA
ncbi:MAG: MATE family efflux transporter [Pseudomonadota bacterium]